MPVMPFLPFVKPEFGNPFHPDTFNKAAEITRDTIRGSVNDVKTFGGLLPGQTGAIGSTTRKSEPYGWDMKSLVVYSIALLFIFVGISSLLRGPQTIISGAQEGYRETVRYKARRAVRKGLG